MAKPSSINRRLFRVGIFVLVPFCLLVGCVVVDSIWMSAARPPENMQTIEDFQAWKRGAIKGKGIFESDGMTYIVFFGPEARLLASGPSAYLFDETGKFVDWSADMGDFHTVRHQFDLSSGNVKNVELEKR